MRAPDRSLDPCPTPLGYQPALDGVRGVAVSLVVAYHAFGFPNNGGILGVEMFFVLSGFLISTLLIEEFWQTESISFQRFYTRRALRLFPLSYLMLAVIFVVALSSMHGGMRQYYLHSVAACAVYVGNFFKLKWPMGLADATAHFWTLAVEEQFYLVWPIVALLLLRRARERSKGTQSLLPWIAGIALVAVAGRTALLHTDKWVYTLPINHADALLLGCALAVVRRDGRLHWLNLSSWTIRLAIVLVVVVIGATSMNRNSNLDHNLGILYMTSMYLVFAAAGALAVLCALQLTGLARTVLETRLLVYLGTISYGLYVIHLPVFVMLWSYIPGYQSIRTGFLGTVLSVLLAAASRRWFEAFFLRLKPSRNPGTPHHAMTSEPERSTDSLSDTDSPTHQPAIV